MVLGPQNRHEYQFCDTFDHCQDERCLKSQMNLFLWFLWVVGQWPLQLLMLQQGQAEVSWLIRCHFSWLIYLCLSFESLLVDSFHRPLLEPLPLLCWREKMRPTLFLGQIHQLLPFKWDLQGQTLHNIWRFFITHHLEHWYASWYR